MLSKPDQDMSLPDTAKLLDIPEPAVLRWARNGALPCRDVQGQPHFRREDVEAWAQRMGMRLRSGSTGTRGMEPNALACAIRRGDLIRAVEGREVGEVLRSLVAQFEPPSGIGREQLVELLLARERLASTAVGDGVALPHPRQPLVHHLQEPRVVVARLARPVEWRSLDQKPVSLLLLVLSCSLKVHLDMLARIALTLKAPDLRRALERAPDLESLAATVESLAE